MDYEIAKKINQKTIFPCESEKMFYYVREGFQETAISEGFCTDLVFTAEMLKGEVKIDGQTNVPIGMGDRFKLKVDPQYQLRCMKLII